MPCNGADTATAVTASTVAVRLSRSSRATATVAPRTSSRVNAVKIRYAVSASSSATGTITTVSSGGLRLVSLAGVS